MKVVIFSQVSFTFHAQGNSGLLPLLEYLSPPNKSYVQAQYAAILPVAGY